MSSNRNYDVLMTKIILSPIMRGISRSMTNIFFVINLMTIFSFVIDFMTLIFRHPLIKKTSQDVEVIMIVQPHGR